MCLYINKRKTLLLKIDKTKTFTFYKKLEKIGKKLISPYYHQEYKPGINKPRCTTNLTPNKVIYSDLVYIQDGVLHLYTLPQVCAFHNHRMVPVKVKKEDIVAYGIGDEVVVKKLFLSQKVYNKALGIKSKDRKERTMLNWTEILSNQRNRKLVANFASGALSGEHLRQAFTGTQVSGQIRSELRERGVTNFRNVARKALKRRGVVVTLQS